MQTIETPCEEHFTSVSASLGDGTTEIEAVIHSFEFGDASKPPLVLLHGFGGGAGVFIQNIDHLAEHYHVFALDGLGFGRSSRIDFPEHDEAVEAVLVDAIEKWRQAHQLEDIYLLGHSFGGYQVGAYALRYPERVKHLIFADPWGFPERPPDFDSRPRPWWFKPLFALANAFTPLAILRAAGPLGPHLIPRFRPSLGTMFRSRLNPQDMFHYLYHANAQKPSGEVAFKRLSSSLGWAKRPMLSRIATLHPSVHVTFMYGQRSWMDTSMGQRAAQLLPEHNVSVHIVPDAGHNIPAENHAVFNDIVVGLLRSKRESQL